jgi:hypothetical protein
MPAFCADTYSSQQRNCCLYAVANIDDDIVIALKRIFWLCKGKGNCYVLNPNIVPLLSVTAILFNTSVSV